MPHVAMALRGLPLAVESVLMDSDGGGSGGWGQRERRWEAVVLAVSTVVVVTMVDIG